MVPPYLRTIAATPSRYAAMISRRSSGSSCAASAVEPTRSQNITVSWRRSAEELCGGGKADGSATRGTLGVEVRAAADARALPVGISAAPQSLQNLFHSVLALPQLGQSMAHLNLCQHHWVRCKVRSLSQS